jgi:hypothetical protein
LSKKRKTKGKKDDLPLERNKCNEKGNKEIKERKATLKKRRVKENKFRGESKKKLIE